MDFVLCWQTDAIPQATPNLMTPNTPKDQCAHQVENRRRQASASPGRIKTAIRDGEAFVTMEDGLEIFYLLPPCRWGLYRHARTMVHRDDGNGTAKGLRVS